MAYYPKHYIKTNLYTDGGEFYYKGTNTQYIGFYWKAANGRFFDGKTPQQTTNYEIVPIPTFNEDNDGSLLSTPSFYPKARLVTEGDAPEPMGRDEANIYLKLTSQENLAQKIRTLPTNDPALPTQQDYAMGEMRRYFCKKINEIQYYEINQEFASKLINKNPNVVWELYIPFNIPWEISGDENNVKITNRNIVVNISKKLNLPKFGDFIKHDYLKYYK